MKRETLIKFTKYLLDVMYFGGFLVTASLPITLKYLGTFSKGIQEHLGECIIIYFVLGIAAIVILRELRKMFKTVVNNDCFVHENVVSLDKMCKWSFFIVLMAIVRTIVYVTPAMLVVILVFTIAGLFSKVLSFVFEKAVEYKEENDFTIQDWGGVMAIRINLDVMMAKRKKGLTELAKEVDITLANLSILKNGKAKAVRLETLNAICKALQCQPGDILEYVEDEENTQRRR